MKPVSMFVLLTLGAVLLGDAALRSTRAEPLGGPGERGPLSPDEARALDDARRHLAAGGDVDASLGDDKSLLGAPADPVTRLIDAVDHGWLAVVRYLLDHGANPQAVVNSMSHYNRLLPVDLALIRGHTDVLRLLKERALPPVGHEITMSIEIGAGEEALPLVSLEEGRWARVTEDQIGSATTADLLIEPGDPQISGLGHAADVFKHVGDETAVALLPGGRLPTGNRAPASVTWRHSLDPREIRVGMSFLVRSSVGAVFRVRLASLDGQRGTLELRYARLETGSPVARADPLPDGPAPVPPRPGPGAPVNEALMRAVAEGERATVEQLLGAGADPKARDAEGRNALHTAASRNRVVIASRLVEHVMASGPAGVPAFDRFLSVHLGLIDAGDATGLTPLHVAAYRGHVDMVRALLSHGADVNATDEKGRTPLHVAALRDHAAVVQFLVGANARLRAQDRAGDRAEDMVSDPALANYLREMGNRQPDPAEQAVHSLLNRFLDAYRRGDRRLLVRLLHPDEAARLPATVEPLPFTPRLKELRVGVKEGEARVVLELPKETPFGREVFLTLTFLDSRGLGEWSVQRVELSAHP